MKGLLRLLGGIWSGKDYFKVEGDEGVGENKGWDKLEGGIYWRGELKEGSYEVVCMDEVRGLLFEGKCGYMNVMVD